MDDPKSTPLAHWEFKTLRELAKECGGSETTLRTWVTRGALAAVREEGRWKSTLGEVIRTGARLGNRGPKRSWPQKIEPEPVEATA